MTIHLIVDHISEQTGMALTYVGPVHGGDIAKAFCLESGHQKYFLKLHDANAFPGMFRQEADGLEALRSASTVAVPQVIAFGKVEKQQYLLLQWIDKGSSAPDCMTMFGAGLAILHQQEQPLFGWQNDNYIGSLHQGNSPKNSWAEFYSECRIMPLLKQLRDAGKVTAQDVAAATKLCGRFPGLFPIEPPALLHGDLWSGNYIIGKDGYAWMFDPAVYCGHREMDIGMTKLFGGFDASFYDAYQEANPMQPGWEQRLPLTQWYPLLVHAVLFGGHYTSTALGIIQRFA